MDIFSRSALIVVDVQRGFIGPSTAHVPRAVRSLLNARRGEFDLVVATRFRNLPDSPFRKWIHWDDLSCAPDTDLVEGIEERADVVIDKTIYGVPSDLAQLVEQSGAQHVYVCGIDTDVCVLQIAAGLFDLGHHVLVLLRATGTNGGHDAQAAAEKLLCRTIGQDQVIG
jgi:nicotinamidase-related amidase